MPEHALLTDVDQAETDAIAAAAADATTKANAAEAAAVQRGNHTGTQSADTLTDGTTNKAFLATERTKLAGVATGATANDTDANLRARSSHTGTQAQSTITDLATDLAAKAPLASPALTGTPTVPTAAQGTSTTQAASTAFVNAEIAADAYTPGGTDVAVADGGTGSSTASGARTALGLVIGTDVAPVASPALTGNPTVPTQSAGTNNTRAASTAYADALVSDTAYDASSWDAVTGIAPSKNAARDKFAAIDANIAALISDTAYDASSWNGVTTVAPSKNAVRDKIESILDGDVFTGEVSVPDLLVQGLTGATTDTRYVGGTTADAPTSGTFSVGDWVIDVTGQLWICTVAGTPGTWVAPGSGRMLGVTKLTAAQTGITGVGSANRVDVTGLTVTVTVGTRPILVTVQIGSAFNGTADNGVGIAIVEGSTIKCQATINSSAANLTQFLHAEWDGSGADLPSAGSHTYKVMAWALVGGSGTVSSGALNPMFIRVTEG